MNDYKKGYKKAVEDIKEIIIEHQKLCNILNIQASAGGVLELIDGMEEGERNANN